LCLYFSAGRFLLNVVNLIFLNFTVTRRYPGFQPQNREKTLQNSILGTAKESPPLLVPPLQVATRRRRISSKVVNDCGGVAVTAISSPDTGCCNFNRQAWSA
jgi:hypothetical protein